MKRLLGMTAAMVLSCYGPATALETTFAISDVVGISPVAVGGTRLLVKSVPIVGLEDELILSAELTLFSDRNAPTEIPVAVSSLTTAWSSTATWTTPWSTPGGDFDEGLTATITLRAGEPASLIRLDVTDAVRSIAEGLSDDRGFVVYPNDHTRLGFRAAEMTVFDRVTSGEIRVVYRSLTAHGIEGGTRAIAARRRSARTAR